jgi:hypothetical protein
MTPKDRSKQAALEQIMSRHDGYEKRTLADLRIAGYRFKTITAARRRLAAERTLNGFTQRQIDIAIAAAEKLDAARREA